MNNHKDNSSELFAGVFLFAAQVVY